MPLTRIPILAKSSENEGVAVLKKTTSGAFSKATNRPVFGEIGNKAKGELNKPLLLKKPLNDISGSTNSQPVNNFTKVVKKAPTEVTVKPLQPIKPILRPPVKDIDDADIFSVPNYAADIYTYLRTLENKYVFREKYLLGTELNGKMRATVVDWLVEVQEQYKLLLETLQIAIGILDSYLQLKPVIKTQLQLVGITSLFIASKYEEIYPPELSDFVYVTDCSCSGPEILKMEAEILKTLSFNLSRPIPLRFLRRYSKATEAEGIHHTFAKFFIELSLMDYSTCHLPPSLIAVVAIYIAKELTPEKGPNVWNATAQFYTGYKLSDFESYIPKIANVIISSQSNTKLMAIKKKYSAAQFSNVGVKINLSDKLKILRNLALNEI